MILSDAESLVFSNPKYNVYVVITDNNSDELEIWVYEKNKAGEELIPIVTKGKNMLSTI
jgi:hypothetical protein